MVLLDDGGVGLAGSTLRVPTLRHRDGSGGGPGGDADRDDHSLRLLIDFQLGQRQGGGGAIRPEQRRRNAVGIQPESYLDRICGEWRIGHHRLHGDGLHGPIRGVPDTCMLDEWQDAGLHVEWPSTQYDGVRRGGRQERRGLVGTVCAARERNHRSAPLAPPEAGPLGPGPT